MKTLLIFAFSYLLSISAYAQAGFSPGYYLTLSGDTVQTQIENRNWVRNPSEITAWQHGSSLKVPISQLGGFGIKGGDVYRKFVVDIDTSPTNLNGITQLQAPPTLRQAVLLRVLVDGEVKLYALNDHNGKKHFYIQRHFEEPRELIYLKVLVEANGRHMQKDLELYKSTLKTYLTGCNITEDDWNETAYTSKALSLIVQRYNDCLIPNKAPQIINKEKVALHFGVLAGGERVNNTFRGEFGDDTTEPSYQSFNPIVGFALDVTFPRGHGRWGVLSELLWKHYKVSGTHTESLSPGSSTKYDVAYNQHYVALHSQGIYTIRGDRLLKPFVSAGIALNVLANNKSYVDINQTGNGYDFHQDGIPLEGMRRIEPAFLLGAGLKYSDFALMSRYEVGNGYSPFVNLYSRKHTFSLQAYYYFN